MVEAVDREHSLIASGGRIGSRFSGYFVSTANAMHRVLAVISDSIGWVMVQQTSSNRNAGRLLDRVNTLLGIVGELGWVGEQ